MSSDEMAFRAEDYAAVPKRAVPCECCGNTDVILATKGDRHFFGLETVVCKRCGLIFTSPRPDDAWFDEFYRLHYRNFYSHVLKPDDNYLRHAWHSDRHAASLEHLTPHLEESGMLLDIGCAEGTFLHKFSQRFPKWTVHGIEPSEGFSEFAREHYGLANVRTAFIDELAAYDEGSFDLVTAGHVLEHLLHPERFFATVRRLLKENGMLFIDVPDAEGKVHSLKNLHIGHVYHFSAQSLKNFHEKHGFEQLWTRKGDEKPQWTIKTLSRKDPGVPPGWSPPAVDAYEIARSFARYGRSNPISHLGYKWKMFRRRMRRKMRRLQ